MAKQDHRENLRFLAFALRTSPIKVQFNMMHFCRQDGFCVYLEEADLNPETAHECGTVVCALGLAGFVFSVPPEVREGGWGDMGNYLFGFLAGPAWSWLFHYGWTKTDNTREGAADRIDWYLEKGVPENWLDQLEGRAELCYKKKGGENKS